jgi:hypothetical protein
MSSASAKERGNKFYRDGNYAAAIDEYSTAIDLAGPNELDLHITYSNRCACYMKLNKFSCALEDAQACVRLKPTWAKGYSRLGSSLTKLGRAAEAVHHFERAQELDPDSSDIKQNLAHAKSLAASACSSGRPSAASSSFPSSASSSSSVPPRNPGSSAHHPSNSHSGSNSSSSFDNVGTDGDLLSRVKVAAMESLGKLSVWWNSHEDNTRRIFMYAAGAMVVYWLFFSGPSRSAYHDDYSHGYGGYGYGGGMSWTMWGSIMLAAWKVPPMFPEVLGQYAQPFFGMSWTTFMWLLNMFSRNRGMGGGYGRGMQGGMFNRRRYY